MARILDEKPQGTTMSEPSADMGVAIVCPAGGRKSIA